jgi:hypothetical protein
MAATIDGLGLHDNVWEVAVRRHPMHNAPG